MGRKTKKRGASTETASGGTPSQPTMSGHTKREIMELVNCLLEKCSCPLKTGPQEWQDFLQIHELVEKLQKKQFPYVMKPFKREEHFEELMSWLKENQVDVTAVTVGHFDKEGHGLQVTQDVKMSDQFLSVPRTIMMTTETAKTSKIGFLTEVDRILQGMPNVVLALHLLVERASPESKWMPYIKTLPMAYTTPLYFKPHEIQLLKGSPVFSEVLNQWRNIARQYAYFYTLFHTNPEAGKLPIKDFCFDDYRWAVSTVMTRQNQIPASKGNQVVSALIPLWDMCNHCNGQITTDFSTEKDSIECFAIRNFPKDSQVFIFYGSRSNAELFLHSGFVYSINQCDRVSLKLGVSKNDPLYSMKTELLSRLAMLPSRTFYLHVGEDPVDSDLLAFLRVMCMTEDELRERITGPNAGKLQRSLRDFGMSVSKENERKAWTYIETRATLLLRAYSTTAEEDGKELEKCDLPENQRMSIQLRRCEKRILGAVLSYSHNYETQVDLWPERPADDIDDIPEDELSAVEPATHKQDLTGNSLEK